MIAGIEHLLKGLIGLDAKSIGHTAIMRVVRRRMETLEMSDDQAYARLLVGSQEEQQILIEAVVVNETWFFRYPESFKTLARIAHEKHAQLGGAGARPLRILSLPCSSGEEPYSIVMALLDAGLSEQVLMVDALDISHRALLQAREGIYGANAFRNADLSFRERHFSPEGRNYRLNERVRQQVRFQCGNLLDENIHRSCPEQGYDIVLCRNLLIYFDRAVQQSALLTLKRLLRPDGYLFAGPAEANLISRSGMCLLNEPLTFAFGQPSASSASSTASSTTSTPPAPAAAPRRLPATGIPARSLLLRPIGVTTATRPATPQFATNRDVVQSTAEAQRSLGLVKQLADGGESEAALDACLKHLTRHGPSADGFFWLGLLCDATGKPAAAQDYFRKALYLNPTHAEALVHLATLLAMRGDVDGSRRLQQRASVSMRRSA